MKIKIKERRVINVPKDVYDKFKKFCEENSFSMTLLISHLMEEEIKNFKESKRFFNSLGLTTDEQINKFCKDIETSKENK